MLRIVEGELIANMASEVTAKDTGCIYMFQNRKLEELKLLFEVFKRVPNTFGLIIQKMNPYILDRGIKIVQDETLVKSPIDFSVRLLEFKAEIDEMVRDSFSNQLMFQKARDTAFQEFMNEQSFTSGYIAQFADKELRQGLKGVPDLEVEKRLSSIINLFCCLQGRDMFLKVYATELATRLLNKTSISQEYEELMIQKLKVECGANQVGKMTQMFRDIQLSKDMQADFQHHVELFRDKEADDYKSGNYIKGVEFNIEVLTSGTWP